MAVDVHKNYPDWCLRDAYPVTTGINIVEGSFVKLDSTTGLLVKAVGASGEYAMVAMNGITDGQWLNNAGKIDCVKENATLLTDQFKVIPGGYTPHCKLQVSTAGGEEGLLTVHAGGASPVVGRFLGFSTIYDKTFMIFDLVRN